jgi:hypothetical protein
VQVLRLQEWMPSCWRLLHFEQPEASLGRRQILNCSGKMKETIDQPTFQQHTCAQHSSINMLLFFFFILQSFQGYGILINPR